MVDDKGGRDIFNVVGLSVITPADAGREVDEDDTVEDDGIDVDGDDGNEAGVDIDDMDDETMDETPGSSFEEGTQLAASAVTMGREDEGVAAEGAEETSDVTVKQDG